MLFIGSFTSSQDYKDYNCYCSKYRSSDTSGKDAVATGTLQ